MRPIIKKTLSLVLASMLAFGSIMTISGCGGLSDKQVAKITNEVEERLNEYIEAVNTEDIDAFMDMLDKDAYKEIYDDVRTAIEETFRVYDVRISVENVELNEMEKKSVWANMTVRYTNANDEEYMANTSTVSLSLNKSGKEWLIVDSMMGETTYDNYVDPEMTLSGSDVPATDGAVSNADVPSPEVSSTDIVDFAADDVLDGSGLDLVRGPLEGQG